jgi:hypothetical protein
MKIEWRNGSVDGVWIGTAPLYDYQIERAGIPHMHGYGYVAVRIGSNAVCTLGNPDYPFHTLADALLACQEDLVGIVYEGKLTLTNPIR